MRLPILLAAALLSSPAMADGPFSRFSVGNWAGGAFTNSESGQFSHCAVSASYKSGVTMHASVTAAFGWNLGFSNPNWTLKVGDTIPLELVFDRSDVVRIDGKALQPKLVVISMPANSGIIRAFRGAQYLEASALGSRYTFVLTSTSRMLPALVDCVKQNANLKVAPSGNPPAVAANDPALQLEAVTLATNFLLASQLPEPKVLNGSEAPAGLGSGAAAWRAAGATGVVRIVRATPGQKSTDVAAIIVGNDARSCQDRFASGRTSEVVDGEAIMRGFSSCDDARGARYAEYYVLPRKQGGFAVFSIATAGASALLQDKRAVFQKAALTALR